MLKSGTEGISGQPKKLSLQERAQLAIAERKKGAPAAPRQQLIFRRDSGAPAPLSFAQQRLWFLDQWEPGSSIYNMPAALRLTGRLDVNALRRAFGELMRRHESLRTTFTEVDGVPVQVIAQEVVPDLPIVDLRDAPNGAEHEARRRAVEESRSPFDLSQGPLLRVALLRLADQDHVLLMTMHHIISDGWSVSVLVRELTTLYGAYSRGEESPLAELPVQYADYAVWQREHLSGARLNAQLTYWKEQLTGAPALLTLPTDHPRPAVQSYRGATHSFSLSSELKVRVHELSRAHGCTLFMTLLAAWQVLLSRYSGQEDVVVGTPIAGRTQRETEDLIGFFVNTLALRTNLSDDPSFIELLGRVRETTLGAYAHQDVPFERLVEELSPERSLAHQPIFQTMFVLQNAPRERMALGELTIGGFTADGEQTEKFDLTLGLIEGTGGLGGVVSYNTRLFEAATIERMTGHFETLLSAALATPARPVSELPLLPPDQRRALLASAGHGHHYPQSHCLHELFERTAHSAPLAPAVTFDGECLTYAELNARANRLAHYLRGLGVGAESRVALLLERSPEMVVAILATLKAGAAYLPIDASYPPERLAFMLSDSGAHVALTESDLAARFPADGAVRVVCLDEERERIEAEPAEDLRVNLSVENAAYVIYTSGSTGTPKGVVVTHANVGRLFASCESLFDFSSDDVWTMFHSYAFDFSVWELWGALLYGGRLVVVPYWVSRSPEAFLELLSEQGVTMLSQTPSAFRQLAAAEAATGEATVPLALRTVVFGGEALEPASLREWVRRRGDSTPELINMYGITETCVHVTYRRVRAVETESGGASLVGVALGDLRLYVLDGRMEPVPEGVGGELYVGGAGLARGYLHRPELTAERFVPDPFGEEPGGRLYRSGDVGRWVSSAGAREVEYLGRRDQQVKVRGFRIELGEIEAALLGHAGVGEVAVLAREGADGTAQLVAYYVEAAGAEEESADVGKLRSHLEERLPEHMMPSYFVRLEALPLTGNGKLDRRALAGLEISAAWSGGVHESPSTSLEASLADIWADVLGLPAVGVTDNFFELGGHSLLATLLIWRIRKTLGLEISLRALFDALTIRELAAHIEESRLTKVAE